MSAAARPSGRARVLRLLAAVGALALGTACADMEDFSNPSTLDGLVLSYPGGQPVEGANVVATGGGGGTTDHDGRFHLTKLPDSVTLTFFRSGFRSVSQKIVLNPGHTRAATFYLPLAGAELPSQDLLFVRGGRIWRTDPYGIQQQCLTANLEGEQGSPCWYQDRARFAFLEKRAGRASVWSMPAAGGAPTFLMDAPSSTDQVRIDPTGQTVVATDAAMAANGAFKRQVVRLTPGAPPRELFASTVEADPALSPDGTTLAWARLFGTWQVWESDRDGAQARPILRDVNALEPAWSPDGTSLAFASNWEGPWEIYVVSAQGGVPRRLTHTPPDGNCRRPTWSPTGDQIAFESNYRPDLDRIQEGVDLYAVSPRGGGVASLVPDARSAAW